MREPSRYAKALTGEDVRYVGAVRDLPEDAGLEVRVTLADDDLEDSFSVEIPGPVRGLTVGRALEAVFPADEEGRERIVATADLASNPDYPEIYDAMLDVVEQWRDGRCRFVLYANNGPEVEASDPAAERLSARRADAASRREWLMDLVIEPRYEAIAYYAESGGDADALLAWMREMVLLYFIDKHGFRLSESSEDDEDRSLGPIAQVLRSAGLIAPDAETGAYAITREGRRFLGRAIAETEGYIDRYGAFDDVLYDLDAWTVNVGSGFGEDLRPQVYWREGVDPFRVVFLLRLYDGTLDGCVDQWRGLVHREEFFDELLRPVLDHRSIDGETLDWIIEASLAQQEEAAAEARRKAAQEQAVSEARGRQPEGG